MRGRLLVLAGTVAALAVVALLAPRYWSAARAERELALPATVLVGPRVSVADLRGRPAIVHYWASWCEPCRREAPELAALAQQIGSRARLVGVAVADDRAAAQAFARRHGWTFPNLAEDEERQADAAGLPMTEIVDPDGRVVRTLYGPQTARGLLSAVAG